MENDGDDVSVRGWRKGQPVARVIVVGAGVGGLTLAQGLRRAGFDVAVYERDDENGRPQGIAVHIDERGTTALRACLPPEQLGLAEGTMGGPRTQTLQLSTDDGELAIVGSKPSNAAAGTALLGARPGRQASRPVLRAALLAGLEDVVHFGAALTRFEQQPDGTVKAWFSDGSTDTADVLVGADGGGSAVRAQYLPEAERLDTGKRMLMGATPMTAIEDTGIVELIGHDPAGVRNGDAMLMALGPLHFAEEPRAARDRWLPALRSEAIESAEDYVMWAMPTGKDVLSEDESAAAVWAVAKKLVTGAHPSLIKVINNAWPEVTFAHWIGLIPPLEPWEPSSVTLIGDAIHLAPGFGANIAMQDARRLCEALVAAAQGDGDLVAAIAAYEDELRTESDQIIDVVMQMAADAMDAASDSESAVS